MRSQRVHLVGTIIAAMIAGVACGDGVPAGPGVNGTMLAKIPVELLWVAERSLAATRSGPDLTIVGEDYRGRKITLELRNLPENPSDPDEPRLLTLTDSTDISVGFAQYRESAFNLFTTADPLGNGTVVITYLSPTRIAGTFSFLARRPVESGILSDLFRSVSNGEFDVRIR
ncbi:MAG TPA: hypothetical protein VJR92_03250 [Gemmatimonadaceae bacterium]|nr:hypothetical protein [Gemmatimonadaceae bacterium]